MTSKGSRERLIGNSAWYLYIAEHGHRVYLQRNLRAVLKDHVGQETNGVLAHKSTSGRRAPGSDPNVDSALTPSFVRTRSRCSKKGEIINEIGRRLAPFDFGIVYPEPVLRIDVRAIKPKVNMPTEVSDTAGRPPRKRAKMSEVRCKCELTIWNMLEGKTGPGRFIKLLRDSRQCTVIPGVEEGGASAAIELDEVFYINATKLFVPVKTGKTTRFRLGSSYRLMVALQPIVYNQNGQCEAWPPVPIPWSQPQFAEDLEPILYLDAKMDGFPVTVVNGSFHDLKFLIYHGRPKIDTQYALQMEALWTKPPLGSPAAHSPVRALRTNSSRPGFTRTTSAEARVEYIFPETDLFMAEESAKRYSVLGYRCPFCRNRNLHTSAMLRFHLVTNHDLFAFKFSVTDDRSWPGVPDLIIHIHDASTDGVYDEFTQLKPWLWERPQSRRFNFEEYLRGDDSWITGKKRKQSKFQHSVAPEAPPHDVRISDKEQVPYKLPKRAKKKFPVPKAAAGGAFFRTSTKRVLKEGELLCESDEDLDESWVRDKHLRVIDSLPNLTEPEKAFIKRWDDSMFDERILAHRFVGDALVRFTMANRAWLNNPTMLAEFFKHSSKLLLCSGISHSLVQMCIEMIRTADKSDADTRPYPPCAAEETVSRATGQAPEQEMNGVSERVRPTCNGDVISITSSDAMDLSN